jgi:hypothetical protein
VAPTETSAEVATGYPTAVRDQNVRPRAGRQAAVATSEGIVMANKSPRKANSKKQGKTLKEKQTAKRLKRVQQAAKTSNIPPTGH